MIDISIILVSYNTKNYTKKAINSIIENSEYFNYEIIVVDNASSDGSQEMIKFFFPDVILIENRENIGFGNANNLAFQIAEGKYFFLLNTDTLLLNNSIKIFYDWFEKNKNKNVGAIGSYLLDTNKMTCHSYGNFLTLKNAIKQEFDFITKYFYWNKKKENLVEKEVDYIIGADLFIPRDIISKIGIFDCRFFMYFEETDLQLRMKLAKYKRIIICGPKIIHLESKSIKNRNSKRILYDKSKMLYLRKYNSKYKFEFFILLYFTIKIIKNLFANYTLKEKKNYIKEVFLDKIKDDR